jgi:hypothetical protein
METKYCPCCKRIPLKLILRGYGNFDDVKAALSKNNIDYQMGGCMVYGDDRDATFFCWNCDGNYTEELEPIELIPCPLEASNSILKEECRNYEAMEKKERYRLLEDKVKICNMICPVMGKKAIVEKKNGELIEGTITRTVDHTCDVPENHLIVFKEQGTNVDVLIKDIESINECEQ